MAPMETSDEAEGGPVGDQRLVVGHEDEIVRTGGKRASMIKTLLTRGYSEEVWEMLVAEDPDLATRLSRSRIQEERRVSLAKFTELIHRDATELELQAFLDENTWIFGYGLDYRVLDPVQNQPPYGGTDVTGSGAQRGDNLRATKRNVRLTVPVAVKPGFQFTAKAEVSVPDGL